MGCLFSKNKSLAEQENPELNPYNYLFESNNQAFINPIYYNKHCTDEDGILYV
jgi:hypothetical protein